MMSLRRMAPRETEAAPTHANRIALEAKLCRRLLDLGRRNAIEPFLRDALELIVEITAVRHGYLELHDVKGDPCWSIACGLSAEEIEGVRQSISRGIIAAAVANGETIITASARDDLRFSNLDSVRTGRVEAVLCVPIGEAPPRGVLYLQGRAQAGAFTEDERELAELFALQLGPLATRIDEQRRQSEQHDATAPLRARLRADGIVGCSQALADALQQAALVAPLDITVLLTGESGCGKSQLARVIHDNSPRAGQPFVTVNCGALPETLVESELFGAAAGAHSTATTRIEGKVSAAGKGTLLLDEIGLLPLAAQGKLLHLLQSKEYYALGAAQPSRCEARVLAATNTDLERAVAERQFRDDLYYRLNVLPIRVPSLRERREDVDQLAAYFVASASALHGLTSRPLSPAARLAVQTAEWPGNIRQLAHALEAAVIRAAGEGAGTIEARHIFPQQKTAAVALSADAFAGATYQEATRMFQESLLRQTLRETSWNIAETAKRLDMARSYVYVLINAFGLKRDEA